MEAILELRMGDGPGASELRYRPRQGLQRPAVPHVLDPWSAPSPVGLVRPSDGQPRLPGPEPLPRPPALSGRTGCGSPGHPKTPLHDWGAAHGRIRPRAEFHSAPMEKKEIVR